MQRRSVLKTLGLAAAAHLAPAELIANAQTPAISTGPDAFFNQVGYRPEDTKIATIRGAAPGQGTFRVRRASDNHVVFEGSLSSPETDAASGDRVQQANFSSLHERGTFRIEFGGQGTFPFKIAENIYADTLRTAMSGFTGQRCGCTVDLGHGYRHPPCHTNGAYGESSGKHGSLPNHGGWHDAGDYGRYVVNSGITCGTLLWAWELYPQALKTLDLSLPERHDHNLPDFLEEVLWNLNWMLQMQDADGGVFHKQSSDHFCAFIMPQDDGMPSNVIGTGKPPYKSTAASGDFAAVMAIAARCYAPYNQPLAAQFRQAAQRAFAWTAANPGIVFHNPPGVTTGEYGDDHVADEPLWAAAELWRTTNDPEYEKFFLKQLPADLDTLRIDPPSWGTVSSMAYWTYAMTPGQDATRAAIRNKTRQTAQALIERSRNNGYNNTLATEDYNWGSNGTAGNHSLLLAVDNLFHNNRAAADASLANLHYILGRNCFGISWVTQTGSRPFMHPHHRPSAADNIVDPWPGLLSGGPNRHPGDPVAKTVRSAPPMRMWIDETGAYSMNEIAINWNAPLVFLLAFANTQKSLS